MNALLMTLALAGKWNGSPKLTSESITGPRPHELMDTGDLVTPLLGPVVTGVAMRRCDIPINLFRRISLATTMFALLTPAGRPLQRHARPTPPALTLTRRPTAPRPLLLLPFHAPSP